MISEMDIIEVEPTVNLYAGSYNFVCPRCDYENTDVERHADDISVNCQDCEAKLTVLGWRKD